jgi:Zinc-finger of C2H2 type
MARRGRDLPGPAVARWVLRFVVVVVVVGAVERARLAEEASLPTYYCIYAPTWTFGVRGNQNVAHRVNKHYEITFWDTVQSRRRPLSLSTNQRLSPTNKGTTMKECSSSTREGGGRGALSSEAAPPPPQRTAADILRSRCLRRRRRREEGAAEGVVVAKPPPPPNDDDGGGRVGRRGGGGGGGGGGGDDAAARFQQQRDDDSSPYTAAASAAEIHAVAASGGEEADLDEAIARLEAELNNNNDDRSSDDEDSSSDSSSTSVCGGGGAADPTDEGDKKMPSILCLSKVKDERIEALPSNLLPALPPSSKRGGGGNNKARQKKKNKKRQHDDDDDDDGKKNKKGEQPQQPPALPGLEAAVREVLGSYVPRSSERLPFYCRVCATQFDNLREFQAHQQTDFHITAVQVEQKLSHCKLCRKQLTSPAQLKEHLASRPHKERLERMRKNHHHHRRPRPRR